MQLSRALTLVFASLLVVVLSSTFSAGAPITGRGGSDAASSTTVAGIGPGADPAGVHSALASSEVHALAGRAAEVDRARGAPMAAGLEPNFEYSYIREGSALVPSALASNQVSPGPTSIGVNDLGLRVNSLGQYVPYSYRTTSIDGTVTINNLSLLPVMTNASDAITVQENAVENNVTLFGQSIYQFWDQNVIFYSPAGDQLQLLTDAWNFSGAPYQVLPNNIYENSPGGFIFLGTYVHQVPLTPPAFTVRTPFTIRLYLNATNIDGRNALFFNYTLASAYDIFLGKQDLGRAIDHGSFDWVIFNSTAGMPAGYSAPPASFLISGNQSNGIGLSNDAEIALCGPSDGFSADFRSLSATAQLLYLNGTTGQYTAVPAAFTTTEDTGESVEGVDSHFTSASASAGTAYLSSGPEFVYGLWNATGPGTREQRYTVDLAPASALMWVSPDVGGPDRGFSDSLAAWALSASPRVTFWLPTGPGETYSAKVMANDYAPTFLAMGHAGDYAVSLPFDPAIGLYVPVIAFGNAGVASIAAWGDGSAYNPYVISYPQHRAIDPLFGAFDEFTEPLYPGLLLSGVSAHVVIWDPPNFHLRYSPSALFFLEYYYGLQVPDVNYLPMEVYDSSNVAIVGAHDITGWFPVTLTGFLMASLFLSNDSHSLVAYDHFSSMGSSMVIVDPAGNRTREDNTVFGNRFTLNPIVSGPDGSSLYRVLAFNTSYTGPPAAGGLGVFSSGNTIYNNLFLTPITAYSPPQNPFLAYVFVNDLGYQDYAQVASTWQNRWNVPLEPAWSVQWVDGIPLTGNVVGAPFLGGNAWANWNGSIPYTDQGLIVTGGDYLPVPLRSSPLHAVVFEEFGLPWGTHWSVVLGGAKHSADGPMVLAYEPQGSYRFTIPSVHGWTAHPSSGRVVVTTNHLVLVVFSPHRWWWAGTAGGAYRSPISGPVGRHSPGKSVDSPPSEPMRPRWAIG